MKNIFIISCLLISTYTSAQTEKGSKFFEGNIGNLNHSSSTSNYSGTSGQTTRSRSTTGFLSPNLGFFIAKDLAIGGGLRLMYVSYSSDQFYSPGISASTSENKTLNVGLIPFVRYYFLNIGSKTKLYFQGDGGWTHDLINKGFGVSYLSNGQIYATSESKGKNNSYFAEGFFGLNYFLKENIALNTTLGYAYNWQDSYYWSKYTYNNMGYPSNSSSSTNSSTTQNIRWNLGFTIFFGKPKAEQSKPASETK